MTSATDQLSVPTLSVTTTEFALTHSLLDYVLEDFPLLFEKHGRGIVGQGVAYSQDFSGSERFVDAANWWSEVVSRAEVSDSIGRPGSGLTALARFAFSDSSASLSSLIIPRLIIGVDEEGAWITTVDDHPAKPAVRSESHETAPALQWNSAPNRDDEYVGRVNRALEEISAGSLHKVVVSRHIEGRSETPLSATLALSRLMDSYPDTHVFAVGSLLGASPETLASVTEKTLKSRVLAGSTPRGHDPESDRAQAAALASSEKDLDEHEYAVRSAETSLKGLNLSSLAVGHPRTIKLKNLWHLATDISADLPEALTPLEIIGALHPTAAVAGTPREMALEAISELESFDRGYFSAPVGWVDSQGNGEFAIALRCAELADNRMSLRALAGAGIVRGSEPVQELAETTLKLQPIIEAF